MPVPPPLPDPPRPAPLSNSDIAANLDVIYSAPPSLSKYGCFFYLQEFSSDEFLSAVGPAERYHDVDVLIQKFSQYRQSVQLYVHSISALETSAIGIFSGGNQPYQVFLSLDKITMPGGPAKFLLPYHTAKLLSAAFVHGLVTRLVLENFKQAWLNSVPPVTLYTDLPIVPTVPNGQNPHPVSTAMDAGGWAQAYFTTISSVLVQPQTWTHTSSANGNADYFGCLNILTDASLQMAGMVSGWLAGDAVTSTGFGAARTAACKAAIWSLIGNSFTYEDIGTLVGYTLTFLNGFIASERTKAAVGASPLPPIVSGASSAAPTLYSYLCTNATNQTDFTPVATALFDFIVAEFYAISETSTTSAAKYQAFIKGFSKGLIIGADALYGELFEDGYQLGYTKGFSVGYAQGYSAGWTEGYAVGYQQGQSTWMSGLQNIISGSSGTTGLSGLLGDTQSIGTLLNDAATVGTAIANLF